MNGPRGSVRRGVVCAAAWAALCGMAMGQGAGRPLRPGGAGARDAASVYAARSLLKKAGDLLLMGEKDRGVKMLETIIEQHGDTPVRYEAYLALGRHYIEQHDQPKAVTVLRHLQELKKDNEEPAGAQREMYLEALYLTGMAYFQTKQYASAFPVLRKITTNYPNTVWANQAYYYVGMCHFAQGNWNKAIESLSLVGTFVDPNSPTVQYVEAGRRFYVRIEDGDLPILHGLDRKIEVSMETAGGDRETAECVPLSLQSGIFLASIPTAIGKASAGDGTLQVVGGDRITTRYLDNNTREGHKDVGRSQAVEVVSTATLTFTMGDWESQAPAAFLGQPLHVVLQDVDHDVSDQADKVLVKVVSRYRSAEEEGAGDQGAGLAADLTFRDEPKYTVRDEVVLELAELGDAPVRTGRFAGALPVQGFREDQPVSRNDGALSCAVHDEVVATFVDELHVDGRSPRVAKAETQVAGEITSPLSTSVNVVPDAVLRTKKNLVEGTAFLELAKIFASMGLRKGAAGKAAEGLERVDDILRTDSPIPSELKEEAFKLRWNLYLAMEDYRSAMATCQLFNRLFPDSPFVDQAMMGVGNIRMRNREYREAQNVFQQVLRLPNSMVKAEAQFRIAECVESAAGDRAAAASAKSGQPVVPYAGLTEEAVRQYKLCAERHPDSPYAGQALGKLVKYYVHTRDHARADDLLEQVFQDYPDAGFLDDMLLEWVQVAYRMGNVRKAYDKCAQLVFEYPASPHAAKAKEQLAALKGELDKGGGTGPGAAMRPAGTPPANE